jgi:ABC-type uncharacterized transport system substrate-binding protein
MPAFRTPNRTSGHSGAGAPSTSIQNNSGLPPRLPTIHELRRWPEEGALISYGPDLHDLFRLAALYVGRILKGAKPADLPVEQPTRFELVINLKAAKALGLDVPLQLQQLADDVIE